MRDGPYGLGLEQAGRGHVRVPPWPGRMVRLSEPRLSSPRVVLCRQLLVLRLLLPALAQAQADACGRYCCRNESHVPGARVVAPHGCSTACRLASYECSDALSAARSIAYRRKPAFKATTSRFAELAACKTLASRRLADRSDARAREEHGPEARTSKIRVWPRLAVACVVQRDAVNSRGSPTAAAEACMGPASPSHRSDARARRSTARKRGPRYASCSL